MIEEVLLDEVGPTPSSWNYGNSWPNELGHVGILWGQCWSKKVTSEFLWGFIVFRKTFANWLHISSTCSGIRLQSLNTYGKELLQFISWVYIYIYPCTHLVSKLWEALGKDSILEHIVRVKLWTKNMGSRVVQLGTTWWMHVNLVGTHWKTIRNNWELPKS